MEKARGKRDCLPNLRFWICICAVAVGRGCGRRWEPWIFSGGAFGSSRMSIGAWRLGWSCKETLQLLEAEMQKLHLKL